MQNDVLEFWFHELSPKKWWVKDSNLDEQIRKRFSAVLNQAAKGELHLWRNSAKGALAEVIVLDQFSRNIFRNKPEAFANDGLALVLAQVAIEKGFDEQLNATERSFLYLPFMHSESSYIHEQAVILYTELGDESKLNFELRHKVIIDKFNRYPHRNAQLGRISTEEELSFLNQPGSSF